MNMVNEYFADPCLRNRVSKGNQKHFLGWSKGCIQVVALSFSFIKYGELVKLPTVNFDIIKTSIKLIIFQGVFSVWREAVISG